MSLVYDIAFSKEMFLDLMDSVDAFGIKIIGVSKKVCPENYVIIKFSDGVMLFHREHWEIILELWEMESIGAVFDAETKGSGRPF